jgi:hypothetical protein
MQYVPQCSCACRCPPRAVHNHRPLLVPNFMRTAEGVWDVEGQGCLEWVRQGKVCASSHCASPAPRPPPQAGLGAATSQECAKHRAARSIHAREHVMSLRTSITSVSPARSRLYFILVRATLVLAAHTLHPRSCPPRATLLGFLVETERVSPLHTPTHCRANYHVRAASDDLHCLYAAYGHQALALAGHHSYKDNNGSVKQQSCTWRHAPQPGWPGYMLRCSLQGRCGALCSCKACFQWQQRRRDRRSVDGSRPSSSIRMRPRASPARTVQ